VKRILVVSDLHVGSLWGLMPPRVVLDERQPKGHRKRLQGGKYGDKTTITFNRTQRRLYEEWSRMCREVGHVDLCVANGDLCDGVNPKSRGLGLWTSDMSVQVSTAVDLLRMVDADRYAGTQGSFYHVGDNVSSDRAVIEQLDGEFKDELAVTVDGVRFHFCHQVGTSASAWMYRTTPIAREMMLGALVKDEMGKFDITVRSHAHYFCYAGYGHSLGVITPCWKGRDEYAQRRTLAFVPQNGFVLFEVEGKTYSWSKYIFTLSGDRLITDVVV
jgi:predicted phosphodiesterase